MPVLSALVAQNDRSQLLKRSEVRLRKPSSDENNRTPVWR